MRKSIVAAACVAVAGCGAPDVLERESLSTTSRFDARALLVLSDVDMLGTAYADGVLGTMPGAQDALTVLSGTGLSTIHAAPASNSVAAWPGAMDRSSDGRFAYVVETRRPAPEDADAIEGDLYAKLPQGRGLTVLDVSDPAQPRIAARLDVGAEPTSVSAASDGRFLLVAFRDPAASLALVSLIDGLPVKVQALPFQAPDLATKPLDRGVTFARLGPDGRTFAANIANTHLQFGRISLSAEGAPSVALFGAPMRVGEWLSMGRWSRDGRFFVVADTGWSASQLGAVLNDAGSVISIRVAEDGAHAIVSDARVSLSPEGFDMNAAGDLLAVVNMERTYLPDRLPYALFGRRQRASLSLLSFDNQTGALRVLDGPVGFEGVLPEDAVFDADGDMIAVAVFHTRENNSEGLVRFFAIDRTSGDTRLAPTPLRLAVARGAHDLEVIR